MKRNHRVTKRLYSIKEAAEYLGRTEHALRSLIHNGKVPIVRIDRRIQLDINDLDDLIEKNKYRYDY